MSPPPVVMERCPVCDPGTLGRAEDVRLYALAGDSCLCGARCEVAGGTGWVREGRSAIIDVANRARRLELAADPAERLFLDERAARVAAAEGSMSVPMRDEVEIPFDYQERAPGKPVGGRVPFPEGTLVWDAVTGAGPRVVVEDAGGPAVRCVSSAEAEPASCHAVALTTRRPRRRWSLPRWPGWAPEVVASVVATISVAVLLLWLVCQAMDQGIEAERRTRKAAAAPLVTVGDAVAWTVAPCSSACPTCERVHREAAPR